MPPPGKGKAEKLGPKKEKEKLRDSQVQNKMGTKYSGKLADFMKKKNAPKKQSKTDKSILRRLEAGINVVSPQDAASVIGRYVNTDEAKERFGSKNKATEAYSPLLNQQQQRLESTPYGPRQFIESKNIFGQPIGTGKVAPAGKNFILRKFNEAAGYNPTRGMGIMDSLRSNYEQSGAKFNRNQAIRGIIGTLLGGPLAGIALGNFTPEEEKRPEGVNEFGFPIYDGRQIFEGQSTGDFVPTVSRQSPLNLQPFLNEEAIARAETDRGTNFYREFENYLQQKNLVAEDLGIQDDFLRRQTDFYNRPPVFGETSGDVRLMGNQGITDEGTAINQGDPIFNLMTNPALDIDGDGRISTTELYGVAQPEPETKFGLPFEAVEAVITDESQLGLNNLMQPIVRDFNQRPLVFDVGMNQFEFDEQLRQNQMGINTPDVKAAMQSQMPIGKPNMSFRPVNPFDPEKGVIVDDPSIMAPNEVQINPFTGELVPTINLNPSRTFDI